MIPTAEGRSGQASCISNWHGEPRRGGALGLGATALSSSSGGLWKLCLASGVSTTGDLRRAHHLHWTKKTTALKWHLFFYDCFSNHQHPSAGSVYYSYQLFDFRRSGPSSPLLLSLPTNHLQLLLLMWHPPWPPQRQRRAMPHRHLRWGRWRWSQVIHGVAGEWIRWQPANWWLWASFPLKNEGLCAPWSHKVAPEIFRKKNSCKLGKPPVISKDKGLKGNYCTYLQQFDGFDPALVIPVLRYLGRLGPNHSLTLRSFDPGRLLDLS